MVFLAATFAAPVVIWTVIALIGTLLSVSNLRDAIKSNNAFKQLIIHPELLPEGVDPIELNGPRMFLAKNSIISDSLLLAGQLAFLFLGLFFMFAPLSATTARFLVDFMQFTLIGGSSMFTLKSLNAKFSRKGLAALIKQHEKGIN